MKSPKSSALMIARKGKINESMKTTVQTEENPGTIK